MHICFIDESGTPPKPGKIGRLRYFVIAGLIMHEAQWHGVSGELEQLRKRQDFRVSGEIKWRYFGPENADADNSVAHLSPEKRAEFRREIYSIITRRKSIKIVACVTSCEAAYGLNYVDDPEDIYKFTYKAVSERFQYFLQDTSRTVGDKQLGIIVADQRGRKQDEVMRRAHHGLVDENEIFSSNYVNYVETIFLTPSHRSVGIQLADMVAGAIARKFNAGDSLHYDQIRGSIRARADGSIAGYGIVKFPKDTWR